MKIYMFGVNYEDGEWGFLVKMPDNVGGGFEIWPLEAGRNDYEHVITGCNKARAEKYLKELKAMDPKDLNVLFPDPCDPGLLEDMVVVEFSATMP